MQKEKDKVILHRMTATQTFKIYQVLNKHFKNNEDASVVVQEIEEIVDKKTDQRKEVLATKQDISLLKEDILNLRVDIEKRFNQNIIWIDSSAIAIIGLLLAFLKL